MGNHDDEPLAMNKNIIKGEAEQQRGKSNLNPDAPLSNLRLHILYYKIRDPLLLLLWTWHTK
ncbi:hypothetical protein GBA52_018853 [Prunus armeniaca]|nr:hypothetical protein GBA52_018853 [Prunus armeniaca]